jgi:probable aminopeptidase NPEPL1
MLILHRLWNNFCPVEINNTDAEGRLVLGDGVAYASRHLQPDVIVDIATLTGAQGIATGQKHAAIVCNDEALETTAVQVGKQCGDLVFPILYCPELLLSEFKSSLADMKNSVKNRSNAQSSCAGHFIESHLHTDFKGKWLHVDMAAQSNKDGRSYGYGVALLSQLLKKLYQ